MSNKHKDIFFSYPVNLDSEFNKVIYNLKPRAKHYKHDKLVETKQFRKILLLINPPKKPMFKTFR